MSKRADALLADERVRMDSFRTRGEQLAGFSGLLLGLLAALVPRGFDDLDGAACVTAKGTFTASLVLILACMLWCLLSVVRPGKMRGVVGSAEVRSYFSQPLIQAQPWQLDARLLRGQLVSIVWHEWANRKRAAALFLASASLAAGVVLVAICLVILSSYGS